MLSELTTVIGRNGLEKPFVRFEEFDGGFGYVIGILAVEESHHEQESGHTLRNCQDEILAVLDEIHLEMAELLAFLDHGRPLVDRDPVGYVGDTSPHIPLPMLEPVPAVFV